MGWDDNGLPTERRVQDFFNVRCDPDEKSVEVDESNVEVVTMKNGRPAAKATVTIDGETHKMFKILSKAEAASLS